MAQRVRAAKRYCDRFSPFEKPTGRRTGSETRVLPERTRSETILVCRCRRAARVISRHLDLLLGVRIDPAYVIAGGAY